MTGPRPISFDRVAPIYDATRRRSPEIEASVASALAEILRGGRCLDLGVGTGRIAGPILAAGRIDLVGVDVGRAMLERARSRGIAPLVRADARHLPFRARAFARSMSTHLLHLVAEWPLVLREIARVTATEYLTVLEHETAHPDLMEEYRSAAAARGIRTGPPGLPERLLAERLPPDRRRSVGEAENVVPADWELGAIASRAFRDTWDVPDGAHREIVKELERRFSAQEVRVGLRVDLLGWRPDRLAEFAASAAADGPVSPGVAPRGGRPSAASGRGRRRPGAPAGSSSTR